MRLRPIPLLLLAALALAGCRSLLPLASSEPQQPFRSYEAAAQALARVVPYRTTRAELEVLGFHQRDSANVVRIAYPDSIARLAPNSAVPLDALDRGLRDCIVARMACQVHEYHFARQSQRRDGPFLADFFNFRRRTSITGWRFTALVVVLDDLVLFTSHGGEPRVDQVDERVNPLGPFQSIGEASGGMLKR